MGLVAVIVALCMWIARDHEHHWWFRADPSPPSLKHDASNGDVIPFSPFAKALLRQLMSFLMPSVNVGAQNDEHSMQDLAPSPVLATPLRSRAARDVLMPTEGVGSMSSVPPEIHVRQPTGTE